MATRRLPRAVSLFTAAVLSVSAIALIPGTGSADPSLTIEQVQQRVDHLYEEAEAATERAHDAEYAVEQARDRLARVDKQVAQQRRELARMSEILADYAAAMYASGGFDPSLQMMLSSDPENFLLQAQSLDQVLRTQDADLRQAEAARIALAQSEDEADQQLAHLRELEAQAAKEKATADSKLDEAKTLLSRLKERERERLAALEAAREAAAQAASREAMRDVPALAPSTPAPSASPSTSSDSSGRGATAVAYAQAQVGKSYVFGAAGPDSFDCSGLTMAAWGQAGVYLPHAVSQQYAMTTRVSDLQPGDLVFFYSDLHHVGIYAGGGTFIHAANPGDGVVAESLYSSYWQSVYMGAGRV